MARTFGVEIECSVPFGAGGGSLEARRRVANALISAGVNAQAAAYSGRDYSLVQVKPDISLVPSLGHRDNVEVVTRVLDFDNPADIAELETISRTLIGLGAKINASCGLHTHIYVGDLSGSQLGALVGLWHAFQLPVTDNLIMRDARRARNGGQNYATPLDEYTVRQMIECARSDNSVAFSGCTYHSHNVNSNAYSTRGTIEIRQQSGTVNAHKMLGWVGYLFAMVEMARWAWTYDGTSGTDEILAVMETNGMLAPHLRDWVQGRNTSMHVALATVEAASNLPSMSRLMALQSLHV